MFTHTYTIRIYKHRCPYLELERQPLDELGVEGGVLREVHDELGGAEEGGDLA